MRYELVESRIRTLFLSDVHLGSRYCQPRPLQGLLERVRPEFLYIVGDFCDGWLLRRQWRWQEEYTALVHTLHKLHAAGTQVTYLLGNHDRCLQRWINDWGDFWLGEKRVHRCSDGRKILVIHGDQFDSSQTSFSRIASASAVLHEKLLGGGRVANRLLAEIGIPESRLATAMTMPMKKVVHAVGQLQSRLKNLAVEEGCDGVLYGHTHSPHIRDTGEFFFMNTGDWLEHCTVIVETYTGQFELLRGKAANWRDSCRRLAVLPVSEDHGAGLMQS